METDEQQEQQLEDVRLEPAAKRAKAGPAAGTAGAASLAHLVPGAVDVVVVGSVSGISSGRGNRTGSRLLRLQLSDGSAQVAAELLLGRGSRLQRQLQEGHVLLLAGEHAARWCCAWGAEVPVPVV